MNFIQLLARSFRPAKKQSWKINLLKTFLQSLVFWTVFLIILPSFIMWLEAYLLTTAWLSPNFYLGLILLILFSLLGVSSGYAMGYYGEGTPLPLDCANKLVIRGTYCYLRNPMAVAGIGQAVAVGLLFGSVFTIIYALSGAFLWNTLVRPYEEQDLEQRFGLDFLNYKERVRCWIPRF